MKTLTNFHEKEITLPQGPSVGARVASAFVAAALRPTQFNMDQARRT